MIRVTGKDKAAQVDLIIEDISRFNNCLRVRMISDTGEEIVSDMTRDRLRDFAIELLKEVG